MKFPNFFIVGAPRSGTTTLFFYLKQHLEIYMSANKEPYFFCSDFHEDSDSHFKNNIRFPIRTEESYLKVFQSAGNRRWARLIQKIYEVDPLTCPKCSGAMRVISFIEDEEVIKKILKHLGLWPVESLKVERDRKARPPPKSHRAAKDPRIRHFPSQKDLNILLLIANREVFNITDCKGKEIRRPQGSDYDTE